MSSLRFPGPSSRALLEELDKYVKAEPFPFVLDLERSKGMRLATVDGDSVVDWGGFFGSKLIGVGHERLRSSEFLQKVGRVAGLRVPNPDYLTRECLDYYALVHRLAPWVMRGDELEVYVVNSGAEAVENAMKYLIHLFEEKRRKAGRSAEVRRFLYFEGAFHGRTIGALNVTRLRHDPVVTRGFEGFLPGNIQIPFPHIDTSRAPAENEAEVDEVLSIVRENLERFAGEVIGIVVEPLQGAGGQRVSLPRFFRELSRLARDFDVGLAFDEVQTAGGQTGDVFLIDQFELPHPPDAVATAKKFGNGVVYMRRVMADRGVLDSTWGGSLADMVRFQEEWRVVEDERLIEQVPGKTARLVDGLEALARRHPDRLFNVRGVGLYQGWSLRRPEDRDRLQEAALEEEGLLLLGAGAQTIRLRPTLDVSHEEIDELLVMLGRLCGRLFGAPLSSVGPLDEK